MTIADRSRVDLREVLRTTCAASPVEAIDVMADGLATLHRSHVRLVPHHQPHAPGRRPLRRLRANAARVQQENGDEPGRPAARHGLRAGAAPPADRADRRWRRRTHSRAGHRPRRRHGRDRDAPAAGADARRLRRRRRGRRGAGLRRHRQPAAHRPVRVGPATPRRSRWPRRSSGGCCPAPTPARPASSRSPAGWSRPTPSAATRSTTRSTATPCTSRSPTPSATTSTPHCWPPSWSAACATAAAAARTSRARPRTANDALAAHARVGQFVTGQLAAGRPAHRLA